jgi:hypothetical protein
MADTPALAGPPQLLHYRPWRGTFHGPAGSVWPIARTALRLLLSRWQFWVLYGLGSFVFLMFFFGQYLAAFADPTGSSSLLGKLRSLIVWMDGSFETYRWFLFWQCNIVMVVLALAGSLLVGNDIRYGSLPFYLSKPVARWHYLVGKSLAVAAAVNLLTTLPALLLFAEFAFLDGWAYLEQHWPLLLGLLGYGLTLTVVLTLLLLASAMWLRKTVPLVMWWATLFVFIRLLSRALVERLRWDEHWRLIDLWNDLSLVGSTCLGVPHNRMLLPQPHWGTAALVLGGVCALCLTYLIYRIRAVEVVQ